MNNLLAEVWIPVVPPIRSGQHKKVVRGVRRDGTAWAGQVQNPGYERAMGGLVQVLFQSRPDGWRPVAEPVVVGLQLFLPHLKTMPKRDRGLAIPMAKTPDWDNIAKLYGDALTRSGWIEDDKIITWGSIAKYRGPEPGILLRMRRHLAWTWKGSDSLRTETIVCPFE